MALKKNGNKVEDSDEKFKKDLFNLRFQKINGQVTNTSKIKETKRNIARLKTFIGAKANA